MIIPGHNNETNRNNKNKNRNINNYATKRFLILALLCAVAQGAWADTWNGSTSRPTYDRNRDVVIIRTGAELAYVHQHWDDDSGDGMTSYSVSACTAYFQLLNGLTADHRWPQTRRQARHSWSLPRQRQESCCEISPITQRTARGKCLGLFCYCVMSPNAPRYDCQRSTLRLSTFHVTIVNAPRYDCYPSVEGF